MEIRRIGQAKPAIQVGAMALLLAFGAEAQQGLRGRIQFTGVLVIPAAPLTTSPPGVYLLPDGNAARRRDEALSITLATGDTPELLCYFAGYARHDARLLVTSYE